MGGGWREEGGGVGGGVEGGGEVLSVTTSGQVFDLQGVLV